MSFASRSMCRGTSPNFNWLVMCVGFKIICLFLLFLFLLTSFLMLFVAFFSLLSSKTVLSFSCLRVTKCRPTCIAQIEWNCFTAAFVCLRQENQHKKALGVPQSKVSSRSFILMNRWRKTKKIAITTQARIWDKDVKKIMKKSDFSSSPNQNT